MADDTAPPSKLPRGARRRIGLALITVVVLVSGIAYGATDDIGWKAVENPVAWHDFHATVLQLLGIDHERLTIYHNGIQRRLTNVHGHVVKGILA